ncbi:hypothetical protein EYC80_004455 [Monilinia laxa]|uniref:Uncharacterized protein n=1 Tax=Monilinia laxa TaxID=61186 RepID=A0A5N6KMU0_MONLA|nr:hypothetical protein EYC80_004455 [Monilinia laxa]
MAPTGVKKTKSQPKARAVPLSHTRCVTTAVATRTSSSVKALTDDKAKQVVAASETSTVVAPEPSVAIATSEHSAIVAIKSPAVATRPDSADSPESPECPESPASPASKSSKPRRSGPGRQDFGVDRHWIYELDLFMIRPPYPDQTGRKLCFEEAVFPGTAKNIELSIEEVDKLFILRGESAEYIEDYHRRRKEQYGEYRQRGSDHCAEMVQREIADKALKDASACEEK